MANPKDSFNRITNPDGTPVRDKDNAQPILKPSNQNLRPAPNLAPGGAVGIRQPRPQPRAALAPSFINIDSDIDADTHRYVTGHFVGTPRHSFLARVSNEPTRDGLNGSSVDQLVLKQGDQTVFRFNRLLRDTDIKAITPEHKAMVERLCERLSPDKARDRDVNAPSPAIDKAPERPKIQFRKPEQKPQKIQLRKPKPARAKDQWKDTIPSGLSIDHKDNPESPWVTGRIITMPGYTFRAKMSDTPTKDGIDGGKIAELQMKKDGKEVVTYDRGWDSEPKTPEQREALHRIRKGLGNVPERRPFKGFGRGENKGRTFDR